MVPQSRKEPDNNIKGRIIPFAVGSDTSAEFRVLGWSRLAASLLLVSTKTKGLNNLLWVYGPNHGSKTAAYYAGDQYVDLFGLDAYTDFVDPQHIKGYDEIIRLPKPFGFTEFGPHGSQKPPGDYDYLRCIDGVQKNFPKATFFLAWHGNWGLGKNINTKPLLDQWLH